jgi:hypothetical protein
MNVLRVPDQRKSVFEFYLPYLEYHQVIRMRNALLKAKEHNISLSAFTHTMTLGTWKDQEMHTRQTRQAELNFYCLLLFGPVDIVSKITKKFSLWR